MNYLVLGLYGFIAVILTLAVDNVIWISGSGQDEVAAFKAMSLQDKIKYTLKNRVLQVLINPRDLSAAVAGTAIFAALYILGHSFL